MDRILRAVSADETGSVMSAGGDRCGGSAVSDPVCVDHADTGGGDAEISDGNKDRESSETAENLYLKMIPEGEKECKRNILLTE